jgi:hypothetical protein
MEVNENNAVSSACPSISYNSLVDQLVLELGISEPEIVASMKSHTFAEEATVVSATPARSASKYIDSTQLVKQGSHADIWKVTHADGTPPRIRKVLLATDEDIWKEALIQCFVHRLDPVHTNPFYGFQKHTSVAPVDGKSFFYIEMGVLNISLADYMKMYAKKGENMEAIILPIYKALKRLHACGLEYHGDLHLGNIMYRLGGFPHEPVFIDFERARCRTSDKIIDMKQFPYCRFDTTILLATLYHACSVKEIKSPFLETLMEPVKKHFMQSGQFRWTAPYEGFGFEPINRYLEGKLDEAVYARGAAATAYEASVAQRVDIEDKSFLGKPASHEERMTHDVLMLELSTGLTAMANEMMAETGRAPSPPRGGGAPRGGGGGSSGFYVTRKHRRAGRKLRKERSKTHRSRNKERN